jgi:hypothetical protein
MARPPVRERMQRLQITVDSATLRRLRKIEKSSPELRGYSATIRYLAQCHGTGTRRKDVTP